MKKSSILRFTKSFINRNFRIKVYGLDSQGNRINKLVGVAGIIALIGIDLPSGTSCFLTYRDNICTEAQAFGNNGLAFALSIKDKIDYLINN